MRRQAVLLVGGLVLGLLGAAMVFMYVRNVRASNDGETLPVYVAESTIQAGTPAGTLTELVTTKEVASGLAPEGAVSDLQALNGLFALEQIQPGETLMTSMFSTAGTTATGQLAIPRNHEAMAITAPLPNAVAQYPGAGDHVSIYATFKDTGPGIDVTKKVLSNVLVLATGPSDTGASQQLAGGANSEPVFVLALTPEEAAQLVFAKENGSIWMTLVPEGQRSPVVRDVTSEAMKISVTCEQGATSAECQITGDA